MSKQLQFNPQKGKWVQHHKKSYLPGISTVDASLSWNWKVVYDHKTNNLLQFYHNDKLNKKSLRKITTHFHYNSLYLLSSKCYVYNRIVLYFHLFSYTNLFFKTY